MILAILLDKKASILQIKVAFGRKGFHPLYSEVKHQSKLVAYEESHNVK
ncbi:hypothetical protein [Alkalibaculum bacchi]|nr:hypothetical protein [Alkalibaculum bacchi]